MQCRRPVERAYGKENNPAGVAGGIPLAGSTGPPQPATDATLAELESFRAAQAEYLKLRRAGSAQLPTLAPCLVACKRAVPARLWVIVPAQHLL